MIEELIAVLRESEKLSELTAEQFTDILWLAIQQSRFSVLNNEEDSTNYGNKDTTSKIGNQLNTPGNQSNTSGNQSNTSGNRSNTGIYQKIKSSGSQESKRAGTLPVRVADASALPNKLKLAKSLKPLMRRVPDPYDTVLDEVATIERIANEKLWIPVLKPALELWLELDLVVDEGVSMLIWRKTILELRQLLETLGAFRNIRTWSLLTNNETEVQIRPGIGSAARQQYARSPRELVEPNGRRLILVVSDCVSTLWRNGVQNGIQNQNIISALNTWANSSPIAIVQMLPKWLWARTALGLASAVQLSGQTPGVANQQLQIRQLSLWDEIDKDKDIKVPILTLEPEMVATWSQMVAGMGTVWTSGVVFPSNTENSNNEDESDENSTELTAKQRSQRFRLTASPMARRLAGLVAVAPVVTLPVIRLIQKTMLSQSSQVHVAEILLGGLVRLKPEIKIESDTNPDEVEYQFIDEVNEILLDSLSATDKAIVKFNLLEQLTQHITDKIGLSTQTFAGFLRDPRQIPSITGQLNPIAMLAIKKLKTLGGKYASFAEELEQSYQELSHDELISKHVHSKELLKVIEQAARDGVTELDLSGNELSVLPPEIAKLTQLKKLILGKYLYDEDGDINGAIGNNLSTLPKEIGLLNELEELHVVSNQLSSLPGEIGQLTNLRSLDLGNNQLSSLPGEIGQLTNLQSLDLRWNQLSSLPGEIGQLTNLQSLDLRWNQLSSLPGEIGQLTNLRSLDLGNNQLSSLPGEIVQLTNLQSLDLGNNQLSSLPGEIVQLTNLQSLNLWGNQLSSLPGEIVQLTNLQSLNLWGNQLSSLPGEIVQLTNLQSLNLWGNQLSSLPGEIVQLTNLQKLDLRGNPVPIPPEILGPKEFYKDPGNVKEILDFYFRVQDPTATEPLYEAKLLIVGEGGAGKTSLAKKIQNQTYQLEADEESTQGIEVIQWKFTQPNGQEFRVNIWDFGGREIYHQTHQFFLTARSLYALVADNRTENIDCYWWLKIIELLSDNSPALIIKNEKQDRQCSVNERQLRGEFTNLEKVIPTNLDTNRGLAEIKIAIQEYISKLPHIGTPLPKIWVRVRSALENYFQKNYISQEEYFNLCGLNGLTDRQDMLRLSRYLHDLGVCLHFQDDPTLKHYVILKPQWGTTAVYKVLDNETVRKNLGQFTQADLADIWKDRQYNDMRDELLQLMMRFKLCYQIPQRLGNYIAPQLLDIDQPNYTWDESNNLILRYKYEFMPKGIITRFIVETHPWIEQQKLLWRNGVVLNKDQTRAKVIENYNQREIKVSVSGSRKKELLAVVTHELDKIHRSFERLQYDTLVPCNCTLCRSSEKPYSYPLANLYKRLKTSRYRIECADSYEMVDVRRLIDDVNLPTI